MARLIRFGPKLVKKNEEKGPKYEILKNLAENWSLEPKLDRNWAIKGATMKNNLKEKKFKSILGQRQPLVPKYLLLSLFNCI